MPTTLDLLIGLAGAELAPNRAGLPSAPIVRADPSVRLDSDAASSERYYVGRRTGKTAVYVVSASEVEPLEHQRYRSDAPFDWGGCTPGALELSFAVLAHHTESRPPDPICMTFCTEVVARLDRPGFVLGYGEIALWLLTAFPTPDEPPNPGRGWRTRTADRLRAWLRRG